MRLEVVLPLGFFGLCLTLMRLGEGMGASVPDPPQVACKWKQWSDWSSCDPCTKTRRRSRSVEVFSQFMGEPCQGSIGDRQSCNATAACGQPQPPECSDTEFQCETGTCIKKRLMCNGDYDCEDGSDEDCDPGRKPCGAQALDNNEQGRTAGYGINILGLEPRMNPFYNDFFNGRCERVRNPNTRQYDRLPWNVGVLHYQTDVQETTSTEIYEDTHSLVKEMLREETFKFSGGATASFKFTPSEESMSKSQASVGGDLSGEFTHTKMIKEITESTDLRKKMFIRMKGRLQLSTYRMRSRELRVADEFLEHIRSLPLQYEKGIYFAFLEDYGTHYTKNGKSGGEYELVYILNQDNMKKKHVRVEDIKRCLTLGAKANVGFSELTADGNLDFNVCGSSNPTVTETTEGKALVDQVKTAVKGGNLKEAAATSSTLRAQKAMDLATFQSWVETIPEAPALINSEPEPIYMLIPMDMPGADDRISNLKQATADYIAEYSVCKCRPCYNGGTVILLDGKCFCLCSPLFEGLACQNFKEDNSQNLDKSSPATHEGNWSCWSAWSSCSGGKHTRTRDCNTEGLLEPAVCRGDRQSEEPC